jgi:putative tricarboxylic transport membrane protein
LTHSSFHADPDCGSSVDAARRLSYALRAILRRLIICMSLLVSLHTHALELHFVIPGGAGGGWDSTARATGMVLRDTGLVERASFENISGAGGGKAIGMLIETAERRPDTLMVNSTPIIVRSLTRIYPYSFRDLTPIARLIGDYQVLVARADSEIRNFDDALLRFRKNPRSVKIAGGSVRGDLDHLAAALAFKMAGEDPRRLAYVPYDAGGKALAGFLTGEGDLLSTSLSESIAYHRDGRLRIIVVSAPQRVAGVETVPTYRESGVDFEFVNWRGFFAPPGIPDETADRYSAVLEEMSGTPEWEQIRSRNGWQNFYLDRPGFVRFLEQQEEVIGDLMIELGFLRRDAE